MESLVGKKIERQVQSLVNLSLVVCGLRAKTENLSAKRTNLCVMVAEGAGLRRAAARARNLVPTGRQCYAGAAGHRIDVNNGQTSLAMEVDKRARRGEEFDVGKTPA
jgi:hypothetical protein